METTSLTAIKADEVRILEERKDGTGVVELPILSVAERVDLSRTETQDGAGTDSITLEDLHHAVANFANWPGPVPVHRAPHRSETSGPGEGFIESLTVRGGKLWARMDLTAGLFGELKARMWRGFSVDYARRARLATRTLEGFLVAGGVFTNRPAADVHFRIAASSEVEVDLQTVLVPIETRESETTGDRRMEEPNKDPKVSLATAEAEVKVSKDKIKSLEGKLGETQKELVEKEKERSTAVRQLGEAQTELQTAKLSVDRLQAEATDQRERIAQLEAERNELKTKLAAKENEGIARQVASLCRAAVNDGVPPATIKAYGDFEKDPVRFLNDNFKSIEALELTLKALPRNAALAAVNSGRKKPGDDAENAVSQESAVELRKMGLDPDYAAVTSETEARALREKKVARQSI